MVKYSPFKQTRGKVFEETSKIALEIFKDNPDQFRTTDISKYCDTKPIVVLNRFWAKGFVERNKTRSPFNWWKPRAKYWLQYMSTEDTATCTICNQTLPYRNFYLLLDRNKKPLRMTMCNECREKYKIPVRDLNKE